MKYTLVPRLYVHHSILSRYDSVDKHKIFYKVNNKLQNININCFFYKATEHKLNQLVYQEFLVYKKLYFQNFKYDLNYSSTSSRKKCLFLSFELMLNSIFTVKKLNLLTDENNFTHTFNFFMSATNNLFFTHLNNLLTKTNVISSNFTFILKSKTSLQIFKNYLFFPKTSFLGE